MGSKRLTIWVNLVDELVCIKVLCVKHILLSFQGRLDVYDGLLLSRAAGAGSVSHVGLDSQVDYFGDVQRPETARSTLLQHPVAFDPWSLGWLDLDAVESAAAVSLVIQ
jgi:hypothetical protein